MGSIHLLMTSWSDYLFEYHHFFANNQETLKNYGISFPWVEMDSTGHNHQRNPAMRINDVIAKKDNQIKYLTKELEACNKLLFCGTPGIFWQLPQLRNSLGAFTGWEKTNFHIVWLPAPKSYDAVGWFRQNPQTDLPLRQQLKNAPALWLDKVKTLLRQADSVKIIPDIWTRNYSFSELAAWLQLPEIPSLAPEIENHRFNSPLFDKIAEKLAPLLDLNKKAVFNLLKSLDAERLEPFLPADMLNEYDEKYNAGIEGLAAEFGCPLKFADSFPFVGKWQDSRKPVPDDWRALAKKAISGLEPAKASVAKRILDLAPQRLWPGLKRLETGEPALALDVLTLAKNQENYILDCMESVSRQKTNFPIRHIILDDGSSDNTRAIIMRYAENHSHVVPLFLKRPRPVGDNVRCLFEASHSRYAALCDGDDYFTDPLKLQKQVDFLEANPDFAISFHPVQVTYENGAPAKIYPDMTKLPGGPKPFYSIRDLAQVNFIQTNSVVYRWRFKDGLPSWFAADLVPGDWYWHMLHAETGLIGFMPEAMSVYRRHPASVYATADIDPLTHHQKHGMKELQLYDVLDRHFAGRFHPDLMRLANGVLADFLQIYLKAGDDAALVTACEKFPGLGKEFLRNLKIVPIAKK